MVISRVSLITFLLMYLVRILTTYTNRLDLFKSFSTKFNLYYYLDIQWNTLAQYIAGFTARLQTPYIEGAMVDRWQQFLKDNEDVEL